MVHFDYYLPKPYDPKEIYAVIQSLLRRAQKTSKISVNNSIFKHDKSKMSIEFRCYNRTAKI